MTPVTGSQKSVVSAFTLAAFSDMGFYEVDMDLAEPLRWGADSGCDFVDKKCIDTNGPLLGKNRNSFFCDKADEQLCSLDRKWKGFCKIVTWSPQISRKEFQYFSDKSLGGFSKELDFCPTVITYSNGNCEDPRTTVVVQTLRSVKGMELAVVALRTHSCKTVLN